MANIFLHLTGVPLRFTPAGEKYVIQHYYREFYVMSEIWIDKDAENYFAASPLGPLLEVGRVAHQKEHPHYDGINKSFELVTNGVLTEILADKNFSGLYGHVDQAEKEWFAREWAIINELNKRISRRRRNYLLNQHLESRPAPYDEPELADVTVSTDGLAPMAEFTVEEGVLLRNGRAYTILPSTPSENSSYWITRALISGGLQNYASVRLDPLMRGSSQKFPRMAYRMLWWGPPLLWDDVRNIKRESFGRWAPAALSSKSEFTDFAWVLRGDEIHLFLEEMPKRNDIAVAGSRYFHVIFSKKKECVIHLDGALRIYSESEWDKRCNDHVHRAGKVGKRIKIFRIDEPIKPDMVSSLGGTYFVWNYDVSHFFGASVPSFLLGNDG